MHLTYALLTVFLKNSRPTGKNTKNITEVSLPVRRDLTNSHSTGKNNSINTIRIGICDSSIGIRKSIERFWPGHAQNDIDAIKWALLPGISGTTTNTGGTGDNSGAGLFFIKSIAKVARNYFMVYSGSGVYKLLLRDKRFMNPRLTPNPEEEHHTERSDAFYFQGTLVAIVLSMRY